MQWYRKILIPTDGSKYAQNAVTRGLYIAKRLNADVTFLTVIDVKATVSLQQGLGVPDEYAYQQKAAEAAVEAAEAVAREMGVRVTSIVKRGSPAYDIIEESKKHDLIVMASRGRTGVARLFVGSVAEKVVRFAACPVLVVKTPE